MKKDKKMILTFNQESTHTRLKVESAKSGKSMNLIINELLDKGLPKQ